MKFQISNNGVTVVTDDGVTATVDKSHANYRQLVGCLMDGDFTKARGFLSLKSALGRWAKGRFSFDRHDVIFFDGKKLPDALIRRIISMANADEDPEFLFKFWRRLQANPNPQVPAQLYAFIDNKGIPIDQDGFFLPYKSVTLDYKDHHTKTFDNRPGVRNEMPRNEVNSDPTNGCAPGFHVGSPRFADEFCHGHRHMVVCRVDPADVCCVPYSEPEKMRVCAYEVIAHHGGELPSTTYDTNKDKCWTMAATPSEPDEGYDDDVTAADIVGGIEKGSPADERLTLLAHEQGLRFTDDGMSDWVTRKMADPEFRAEFSLQSDLVEMVDQGHMDASADDDGGIQVTLSSKLVERLTRKSQSLDSMDPIAQAKLAIAIHDVPNGELLDLPMNLLLNYAGVLKILNAGEIAGGKVGLVDRIKELRRRQD